ncbi:DNA-directed RNA polymerase III subunit RPC6 [Bienertia sinuspersici]
MSGRGGALALKRKRPGSDGPMKELDTDENNIYNLIKSKGDTGIWKGDIRRELNITNTKIIDNCVKSLQSKQMIKEVSNVQAKGKKRLMAMEFEPSKELTGGVWYREGLLDDELIKLLKRLCLKKLTKMKVATADGMRHEIKMSGGFNYDFTVEEVKEVLDNLVLEKEITRVKSNGLREFAMFPINADCYKLKSKQTETGAFSLIPCGICPRINHCAPDGIISPVSCVYYTKWLEF